jgi:competence protein ComEC
MAGALDLIAAVGSVFGERPEAVRAVPRPPDAAFVMVVLALLWACLWRGALRWGGALLLVAGIWMYLTAPRPIAAFDADLRAVFVRGEESWTLVAREGRSTYARDRLGAMLGLSPATIERLTPPEWCGGGLCLWRSGGLDLAYVQDDAGFAGACRPGVLVIAQLDAPTDFSARCAPSTLMDAADIARYGGAVIYEGESGPRVERAWRDGVRRPWTRRGRNQE